MKPEDFLATNNPARTNELLHELAALVFAHHTAIFDIRTGVEGVGASANEAVQMLAARTAELKRRIEALEKK